MKTFKISLKDKAAFLNRLKKFKAPIDTENIKNNETEGYFIISTDDEHEIQIIDFILKKAPKIHTIKESRYSKLVSVIKEELAIYKKNLS
jgi:hypothetical protein